MGRFREKKAVYNIWKKVEFINEYSKISNTNSQLYKILVKDQHVMQQSTRIKLTDIFEYSVDKEDLNKFEVICKAKFCKLIGEKEDLFYFKKNIVLIILFCHTTTLGTWLLMELLLKK